MDLTPEQRAAAKHLRIDYDGHPTGWLISLPEVIAKILEVIADVDRRLTVLEQQRSKRQ